MFRRKRVFIIGLIGFALSSALGGAAPSFGMLVAARTLQGAFGAILAPSALGTLVSTFRDPRERARAFGVFGSVAGGGGAVGLILGGVLTQYLSWRWTLYVNLISAAHRRGRRPDLHARQPAGHRPRMDWAGALLASAGLFALVFGFSHAELAGWTAALTIGSLVGRRAAARRVRAAPRPGQSPPAAAAGRPGPHQGRLLPLGRRWPGSRSSASSCSLPTTSRWSRGTAR